MVRPLKKHFFFPYWPSRNAWTLKKNRIKVNLSREYCPNNYLFLDRKECFKKSAWFYPVPLRLYLWKSFYVCIVSRISSKRFPPKMKMLQISYDIMYTMSKGGSAPTNYNKQCFGSGRIRIIWPDPDPYQKTLIWSGYQNYKNIIFLKEITNFV